MQSHIELLPEHIIDQIKAGEVVEKPANVIKELIENSIDANASEVKITIKNNGLDLIAIEDDGDGMSFDDLPYAFCRHATSKIKRFDDIYKLTTFGFRGEALASISSISRLSCHSAPLNNTENGGKYIVHGAQPIEHSNYKPTMNGTSLYIKDLFYNTPARLKFVRSKISERNSLRRIIHSFIIMNPQVKFVVNFNEEEKEIFQPTGDQSIKRIEQVFFLKKKNINKEILTSQREYLGSSVNSYISKHSTKGHNGKQQFLFVNNRLFSDKKVHQIVTRNLEPVWGYGQSGNYLINIRVPENEIDVNVHPNKILVKFLKENEVFSLVSASLKDIVEEHEKKFLQGTSHQEMNFDDQDQESFQNNSSESILEKLGRFNDESESSSNQRSFSNSTSSYGQSSLFSKKSELQIDNLAGMVFLLKDQTVTDKRYLLNMNTVIHFLLSDLRSKGHIRTLPLLISEPYEFKPFEGENQLFSELQDLGFELERLNNETIVLRAIPEIFESLNYTKLTNILLEEYLKSSSIEKATFSDIDLDSRFVYEQVNSLGLSKLIDIKSIKSFKEKDLLKVFHAKNR